MKLSSCRSELEEFTRYIFDDVFDRMKTNDVLVFDLDKSPIKCLICFLTRKFFFNFVSSIFLGVFFCFFRKASNEIDKNRMSQICGRKTRPIRQFSNLSTDEVYRSCHLSSGQFFIFDSDVQLRKRVNDRCLFKSGTFAEYFLSTQPEISFERDGFLATLKGIRQPRINFLWVDSTLEKREKDETKEPTYLPIEYLRYAPLNQNDWKIIYRLPSLLCRVVQLYRIEKLRKLLIKTSLIKPKEMPMVTFCSTIEPPVSLFFFLEKETDSLVAQNDYRVVVESEI